MRALVMAAGLGTRLRPLTDKLPKPLVPLAGRPMVEYVLDSLAAGGITEAVLNTHYLPARMEAFVAGWNQRARQPRLELQDESRQILDSGGALAMAASWLFAENDTALVCNADSLARPDFRAFRSAHDRLVTQGVECSLAICRHAEAGVKYTGLKLEGEKITAFEKPGGAPSPTLWHFPGFYLVQKSVLARLPAAGTAFSIVDLLWKPLAIEGKLGAWKYEGPYRDLGTAEDLQEAEEFLKAGN